jgi:hypothetical protein
MRRVEARKHLSSVTHPVERRTKELAGVATAAMLGEGRDSRDASKGNARAEHVLLEGNDGQSGDECVPVEGAKAPLGSIYGTISLQQCLIAHGVEGVGCGPEIGVKLRLGC